jgi:hypothetical protein
VIPRPIRPLLALLVLVVAGCDLFKPAEPEQPVGETIAGNYTDVDSTLNTLALAIRVKAQLGGENAYLRGFADPTLDGRPFVAEFDPATVSRYLGAGGTDVPNPWRREQEALFYGKFAGTNAGDTRDMSWAAGDRDDPPAASDSAIVFRKYLVVGKTSTNGTIYTIGSGQAEMHFVRNSRGWIMVRWIDREDPARPTGSESYGYLRLNNR